MKAIVCQIDAFSGATPVTLRVGSHDDEGVCHLDGETWLPAIGKLPTLAYDLFDGAFEGQIVAPTGELTIQLEPVPTLPGLALHDARLRLWRGDMGATWSGYSLLFDGRVTEQPSVADGAAKVAFGCDDAWLDEPLLSTYAGTGGAEGATDLAGNVKPLLFGAVRFAPGVLVDAADNIYQLSDGSIDAVEVAFDKVVRFGAASADHATFAALKAAAIPPGGWATCLAGGYVRLGAPAEGTVSFHVRGSNGGSRGFVRRAGSLIHRIAELRGQLAKVNVGDLDALDAACPWDLSPAVLQQTTPRALILEIAQSVNAVPLISWTGQLRVKPVSLGSATGTLASDGSALPPVASVEQIGVSSPWWRLAQKSELAARVHNPSEMAIADPAFEDGTKLEDFKDAVEEQLGDIQEQTDRIPLIDGYVADMQPRVAAAEQAIEDLQNSVTPPDIDELRDRILAAEGEIDTVETTLGTQDARITTAQTTADTAVGDLAEVSTRLTTAEGSISSTLTVIQTLEDTVAQANLELSAQDARITQNALAISTVEGQQASLELDLDTLGASVNSLAIATSTLDGSVATLTTELRASGKTRGGNLLTNTDFANDLSGWSHGGSMLAEQFTRNYPDANWHPPGEYVLTMYHGIKTPDGTKYSDAATEQFAAVEANKPYEFSVYVAAHRCLVQAYIAWINAAGAVIYYQPGAVLTALGGGKDLTNYSRYWFKDTAPAGAVAAGIIMRKYINTLPGEDSYAWWCRPQLAEIGANDQSPQAYKPGNAGASIRFQAAALATLTTQLAQVDLSAQTAGVNAGLALQAITQFENDVTLLYGRAALTVGVGGIISGVEINGTPVGSTIDFSATATRFRDPSGAGPRTEYMDGVWRTYAGSTMLIWGSPFGTSGQFVRWFGPALSSISQCSEGNAIEYLKTNGDAYFGGSLSAGTLRNAVTGTSIAATADVLLENVGSNGGTRQIVLSYNWLLNRLVSSGTAPSAVNPTATIRLYRGPSASGTLIGTLNVGPGDFYAEVGDPGQWHVNSSMSGSLTVNDPSGGTSASYYAVIVSRSIFTGGSGGTQTQRLTIVCTEE